MQTKINWEKKHIIVLRVRDIHPECKTTVIIISMPRLVVLKTYPNIYKPRNMRSKNLRRLEKQCELWFKGV